MITAFDAAYPPATVPGGATVACIYIGGDTPNPITKPTSVPAYTHVRWWLPVWVRSNPTPAGAAADGLACVRALEAIGAPTDCTVVLDLETAVTVDYVEHFAAILAPHPVLPYGSRSTLTRNPRCAGYFLAWPTWTSKVWPPYTVAIQHVYAGSYDLSTIQTSVVLWDRQATVTPRPPGGTVGVTIQTGLIVVTGVSNGHKFLFTCAAKTRENASAWSIMDLSDVATGQHVADASTFTS